MKLFSWILILNLAAGPALAIEAYPPAANPAINPGVITTDFGKPQKPGTVDSFPVYGDPANRLPGSTAPGNSVTDNAGNVYNLPATDTPAANSPGSAPLAANPDFSKLSCDQKCDTVNGAYDAALKSPVCGDNLACSSCIVGSISKSQTGQYCQARNDYKKATRIQNIRAGLYVVGAALCFTACANPEPFSRSLMEKACKIGSVGLALQELVSTKKFTMNDEEVAGWLKATDKVATLSNAGLAGLFVAEKLGVKAATQLTQKSVANNTLSCVTGGVLTLTAITKRAQAEKYKPKYDQLCGQIDLVGDTFTPTAESCRVDSGLPSLKNVLLSYAKPKPFTFDEDEAVKSAASDGGLVGELYQDMKPLEDAYNALDPKLKARFEAGEDPIAVARSAGMIPSSILNDAEKLVAKYQGGEKSALFDTGGAVTTVASLGNGKMGTGVLEDSFGKASVAASAAGEGVSEMGFGAGANASHSTVCGQGPFHAGCDRSIFSIVSNQLSRKSKDESVANLNPVLPLNQMRAGLKVEADRAPASSRSTVK